MTEDPTVEISGIEIDISIIRGRDLVAKDRNFLNKKTTSDVSFYFCIYRLPLSKSDFAECLITFFLLNVVYK